MKNAAEKFICGIIAITLGLTALLVIISIPLVICGIIEHNLIFWGFVPSGIGLVLTIVILSYKCIQVGFKILIGKDEE